MSIISKGFHKATSLWANKYLNNFYKCTHSVEATQRKVLSKIIEQSYCAPAHGALELTAESSYEQFSRATVPTSYKEWNGWIDKNSSKLCGLTNNKISRYQPTSGSTSAIKWIPYTQQFLAEINQALMPWIAGMYNAFPGIKEGSHYWSVSWVPTELRESTNDNVNDDLRILPFWERIVAGQYMSVPESVSMADTCDDTLFASIAWLLSSRDLSFISIWSPTFLLTLLEQIEIQKDELITVLTTGQWTRKSLYTKRIPCPQSYQAAHLLKIAILIKEPNFLRVLWPNLSLISCWNTASSAIWAKELEALFPNAPVKGKGLWATEGAVTFPLDERYPLAINSHFYEFIDLDSNTILPSWSLRKGMDVSPLLTTGSGFYRYHLKDYLKVDDFINDCPSLTFIGRIDGTDMVGEKISTQIACDAIHEINQQFGINAVAVIAIPSLILRRHDIESNCRYILLCEESNNLAFNTRQASKVFEHILQKNFHYQLARDLGQLDESVIISCSNTRRIYEYRCEQKGMSVGNIKHEPLYQWDTSLHEALEEQLKNDFDFEQPILRALKR